MAVPTALPAALGLPPSPVLHVLVVLGVISVLLGVVFLIALNDNLSSKLPPTLRAYVTFAYACFMKPHDKGTGNQQDALESFYKAQASVYDATRTRLLRGREDMLSLAAAQLRLKSQKGELPAKPVWVDIGGGTGHNIEMMGANVDVPNFFRSVYVVDLSSSLCDVARARFERLGWKNVKVVCQDARAFRLHEHEPEAHLEKELALRQRTVADLDENADMGGADLVTMSYSLSMIPDFYSVVDSLSSLLSKNGILGVVDFYVQNQVDYSFRNYTGGLIDRHCTWLSRTFWRTWFELDRVNLESARRDYLEYRFGTILSGNCRNHMLGVRIPYYMWLGCHKDQGTTATQLAELNAAATESPFLSALDLQARSASLAAPPAEVRSKAYECAIVNLQASLPLPAAWYQNHHWRIYFDSQLQKHTQFNNEYIYAFTWEDSKVDARLLKVQPDDVILAITSAGDNILSLALEGPKRIHAVDLNPSQNHLLELKAAAFTALPYEDVWRMFGEGKHPNFRELLLTKLSPHMSSIAFQYWLSNGQKTFGKTGLYYTGGSRHALSLLQFLIKTFGLQAEVDKVCHAQTLNEQREIWEKSLKKVLFNRMLAYLTVHSEKWLWKALGVPPAQRNMITQDYMVANNITKADKNTPGNAIWEYCINTIEPMIASTLVSESNHYYYLCLKGKYSTRSHPEYLDSKAHAKFSRPGAFDGLRIHTDEINEVLSRMTPGTLTIAIVMDSMDWFDPTGEAVSKQIKALNRALKMKGRVMLRSAGLTPWYVSKFEQLGFAPKRVGARFAGECIDRVNMYASTWICTKVAELDDAGNDRHAGMEKLAI